MYANMRSYVFLIALLAVIGLVTGCLPVIQAGEPPTAASRPTPALTGVVRVGEMKELLPSDGRLSDWQLNDIRVDGDVLLATIGESDQVVVVNLRSGESAGLDSPFVADDRWPISDRYFVWEKPYNHWESSSILIYDARTGDEREYGRGEGYWLRNPDASDQTIVWDEKRASNARDIDIYAYDIAIGRELIVVQRPGYQMRPKIDGEWIVYIDDEGTDPRDVVQNLYLHNLTTGEDMLLGSSPYASRLEGGTYDIDNDRVVWVGRAAGRQEGLSDLNVYDLQSRTECMIDTSPACVPTDFRMAGDLILFGCQDGFYGYDLAQDVFFEVPYPEHSIGEFYLSETYVVFRIQGKHPTVWDYLTPGASPMPPREYWLTPQPARFRLFVAPITR